MTQTDARTPSGPVLVTIGETMVMVTPSEPQPLAEAEELSLRIAGAESNVASWLAGLGYHVRWHGYVGDDPLGQRVLRELRQKGVDVSTAQVDPTARTGVYFKDPCPDDRQVLYYRDRSAASRMGPGSVDPTVLGRARILHLSGITAALSSSCRTLVDALIRESPRGTLVSFDVNHRPALWPADDAAVVLADLADASDVVFVGLDEAQELWGCATPAEVRERLPSPSEVVVKDGAVGAHVLGQGSSTCVPALKVDVVEPIGAGDAFAAGYLAGVIDGLDGRARLRFGHLLAASVLRVTHDHVVPPDRSWIDQRLSASDEEWAQLDPSMPPGSDGSVETA